MTEIELQIAKKAVTLASQRKYYQYVIMGYHLELIKLKKRGHSAKRIGVITRYLDYATTQLHLVEAKINSFDIIAEIMDASGI